MCSRETHPLEQEIRTGRCDTPEEREFCRAYNVMESVAEWTPTVGMFGAVTTIVEANMRKPCRHAQRFPRRPPGVIGRVGSSRPVSFSTGQPVVREIKRSRQCQAEAATLIGDRSK